MGSELLLAVRDVLATEATELALLQLEFRTRTLVRRVIAVLALSALEKDVAFLVLHDFGVGLSLPHPHPKAQMGQAQMLT